MSVTRIVIHNRQCLPKNDLACLLIIVFSLIFFCATSLNAEDVESMRKEEKKRLEVQIQRNQIKIQRLQSGLEDQKEGVERTKLQEKGILAELKELDLRLLKMGDRLRELEERKADQQRLITEKELELEEVKNRTDKVQLHMQKRIGAYYKLGKIDLINITFSTKTLPELLRFHDSFATVIEYDQDVIKQYRATARELESAKEALTLERGLLDEFILQANENEASILAARQEKARLLNRVKNQSALYGQAIKEIEKAKSDLSAALLAMRKKEELYDQGFLMSKKKHISPLQGKVIGLFNQKRTNQFGISRKTPGISISAPDGAKIRAIFDGRVIFSGYLKGYGNTVIIDHGYQYFTICSRIERLLVKKNTNVKRHDIIGIMGSTATILDDGLYFEIRHKDTPLNPLDWLDTKKLAFADDTK